MLSVSATLKFVISKSEDSAFVSVYTEHICESNHISKDARIPEETFNTEKVFLYDRPNR